MKWTFGLVLLLAPVAAAMAQSTSFRVVEGNCSAEERLMTFQEASDQRSALCPTLDTVGGWWSIARLADGASIGGTGYGCTPGQNDPRVLGHSVCVADPLAVGRDHRHMLEEYEEEYIEAQAAAQVGTFDLNPDIVHLVQADPSSGNFLFRGNMPVKNGQFQYDDLAQAMRNVAAAAGKTLPPTFQVIDISLVNELTPGEKHDLDAERAFWSSRPQQGQLINNPIYGSLTSPNDYPAVVRRRLEQKPSLGHLGALIDQIHALVTARSSDGVPVLLYVHCEAGKDRTGEVIAAYSIKYMGVSYQAALANARTVAGRDISRFSRNGLQWQAYYLTDYLGITTVGPIH